MIRRIKEKSDALIVFLLFCVIGLICLFSNEAKEGAKSGIELCENAIIPSLLPVLIICSVITKSRLSAVFEKCFGSVFEKVFSLPRAASSAVSLGLIGGYPSGAVLTCSLLEQGKIDDLDARRIMKFNLSPGIAFTVTAVGSVTYGSVKTGALLFASITLSGLVIAFFSQFQKSKNEHSSAFASVPLGFSDALCEGVEATVKALAIMSAYIVLFSSVFGIINPPEFIVPIFEITNGICTEKLVEPPFACFFLAFGGLCVDLQIFGFLKKMNVKYTSFFISRMTGAVLSFFFYKVFSAVFPEADAVFSNISSPVHTFSSGGITLSMLLIIGCAVIIFDIENSKLKLHSLL